LIGRWRWPSPALLLGRVVDGLGRPQDEGPAFDDAQGSGAGSRISHGRASTLAWFAPINPLDRTPVVTPIDTGVRAINALLTVGVGQRVGIFAGSGVGKSVMLGMLARNSEAEIVVVALIGERGREIGEFVQHNLGEARKRAIVVTAAADAPPVQRLRAAEFATHLAEQFRHKGKRVLLLLDSLTRVAQAQREIGLAIGEPPTTKGYPPSVFSCLPRLVERAGNIQASGSITAFYTVLMEDDDLQDPIVDAARAVLDGHIVLSRPLAEQGHFPAIDLGASLSRVMGALVTPAQLEAARRFRAIWERYNQQSDLIELGAYKLGSDPRIDESIRLRPAMVAFLQQSSEAVHSLKASMRELDSALSANTPATVAANG